MLLNCGAGKDSWESLDCKEIQPVHPKGNQSWIFIGRTDAEAETPILWSPDVKNWLIGKDPDAGKNWRWEEKEMTEDEMAGGHHWLNGCEFEWTPGVGDGQGGLACCGSWGHKESDTTEQLNWIELKLKHHLFKQNHWLNCNQMTMIPATCHKIHYKAQYSEISDTVLTPYSLSPVHICSQPESSA